MKAIYGYPVLPKAGLANMLIPWAECYLWCKDQGVKQIAPFWRKIRIGPYLRGERDKRQYQRLFSAKGNIGGLKRILLLMISKQVTFENYTSKTEKRLASLPLVVRFSDMNHMERIVGRNNEILNELNRITRLKYRPTGLPQNFIAIHIRRGDFPQKSDTAEQIYFQQPIEWYIEALQTLQKSLGLSLNAVIFSDATDTELTPLLKLDNVIRSPFSESISDLLAISQSTVLITSRSSFSLFGAYLGQLPSIWYEGKNSICGSGYMPDNLSTLYEAEWMPGKLFAAEFIEVIKKRVQLANNNSNK